MKKLAVIVPYRDRKEHMEKFIPHMEKYLSKDLDPKDNDFHIFIIEQFDDKPFNRAKLLNIGFKESEDYDYYVFHDIDMLPVNSDYTYENAPTHLATQVEQFGFKLPYDGYFGGVTLFDKKSFIEINGYANGYWGWGAEDDDVLRRCLIKNIPTFRKNCRYRSLIHNRDIDNKLYTENLNKLNEFKSDSDIMIDGLSTLEYEKVNENKISEKCTLIKVSI